MPSILSEALDLVPGGSLPRKLVRSQIESLARSKVGFIQNDAVARRLIAENLIRPVKKVGSETLYEPVGPVACNTLLRN